MKNEVGFHVPVRPMPPEWIFEMGTSNFVPAPEMWDWIKEVFLNPESNCLKLGSYRETTDDLKWCCEVL